LLSARLNIFFMNAVSSILVGPAGWNYPDWKGIVYLAKRPRRFSELAYLSGYFPVIEINSTFYAVPSTLTVEGWLKAVSARLQFKFCVKLWQGFTHGEAPVTDKEAAAFKNCLKPMIEQNRLVALLIQFPWSFKRATATIDRLQKILDVMREFPCAVEFRHAGWQTAETNDLLAARSVAFVNIDQPVIGQSVVPSSLVTAPFAYVRLHGRNADNWFREGAGRDTRYDYLYTPQEIESWSDSITSMSKTAPTIVIFNNHFRGQAVVNAFQLENHLTGKRAKVPAMLLAHYPQQLHFAAADTAGKTLELF
jgi:uncharacterized protein YecE (DUF72 family)